MTYFPVITLSHTNALILYYIVSPSIFLLQLKQVLVLRETHLYHFYSDASCDMLWLLDFFKDLLLVLDFALANHVIIELI